MHQVIILLFVGYTFFGTLSKSQAKDCDDSHLVYKTCTSQEELFQQGLAKATSEKKLLIIKYGYESCGWCMSLHKLFKSKEFGSYVDKHFVVSEVNILLSSGKSVFAKNNGGINKDEGSVGYPFLVVLNPANKKSLYIQTGDLEDNSRGKGHDAHKVRAALERAASTLRL